MTTASGDTVPAQEPSDAELIDRCRAGESADTDAFEGLYQRHAESAKRLARRLSRDQDRADDLVAEAFTRILAAIRRGNGPDLAFRAYLLTVVRNVATEWATKDKRITLVEGYDALERPTGDDDPVIARTERDFAAKAFAGLPERWQAVLWHTEVEGETPAAIAPMLGLSPNAVAALALRAREGLRQEYLRAHMSQDTPEPCRDYADRLARLARGRLGRGRRALESHMDDCARCSALYAELVQANHGLGALIGGAVLGTAAVAYGAAEVTGASSVSGGVGLWLARLRPRGSTTTAVAAGAAVVVVAAGAFAAVKLTASDAPSRAAAAPAARTGGNNNSGNNSGGNPGNNGGKPGAKPNKPSHHNGAHPNKHGAKPGHQPPATEPQSRSTAPKPQPRPSSPPTHASPSRTAPKPPAPPHAPSHTPPRTTPPAPTPPTGTPTPTPSPTTSCSWIDPSCWFPGSTPTPSLPSVPSVPGPS